LNTKEKSIIFGFGDEIDKKISELKKNINELFLYSKRQRFFTFSR
jgi:hypothetical protein